MKTFDFSSLKLKDKIYLLLLPLIILFLIVFFTNKDEVKKQEFKVKVFDKDYIKVIKSLERYALDKKIKLVFIKNEQGVLSLKANLKKAKIADFLNYIENYNNFSQIKNLSIKADKNLFFLDFNIEFLEYKKLIKNKKNKVNNLSFKHINNYILVNGTWILLEDEFKNCEFIEIKDNKLIYKNSQNIIKEVVINANIK